LDLDPVRRLGPLRVVLGEKGPRVLRPHSLEGGPLDWLALLPENDVLDAERAEVEEFARFISFGYLDRVPLDAVDAGGRALQACACISYIYV